MAKPIIGVDVDDLGLQVKDGLRKAADLGFDTVELATVRGDVEPSNLSSSGRRHLSHFVDGLGLRIAALVADFAAVPKQAGIALALVPLSLGASIGISGLPIGSVRLPLVGLSQIHDQGLEFLARLRRSRSRRAPEGSIGVIQ